MMQPSNSFFSSKSPFVHTFTDLALILMAAFDAVSFHKNGPILGRNSVHGERCTLLEQSRRTKITAILSASVFTVINLKISRPL